jgi:hypothetical protein
MLESLYHQDATLLPIWLFIIVGFMAQMIDGALGMAYGVSSTTFLLTLGVPPAFASASVHMAEVVTTGVSGISHWRLGNINKDLVKRLILPGVVGGVIGAYLLSLDEAGKILKPFVSAYLLLMGVVILWKAIQKVKVDREVTKHITPLALVGGFFDAIGGGGWGQIVTTTLVARGNHPRYTIGSVNMSEFFVTLSQSIMFVITLPFMQYWRIITGLLIGGVIAAPMAAIMTRRLPTRALMGLVGVLIIVLSLRTILQAWGVL